MTKVKTSFQTFVLVTRKKSTKQAQQIQVKQSRLIRGNMQKCLTCNGKPRIILGKGLSGLYPKDKPYPHKDNCTNKF